MFKHGACMLLVTVVSLFVIFGIVISVCTHLGKLV